MYVRKGGFMSTAAAKECRLNLRATKEQRSVIERGATVYGQRMTDFVVSSACEKAEQILAEQRNFVVPPQKWDAFVAALDRPTVRHERLARLLSEPSILER
jgi:uncharacterized protein (DUF1778 family)